jgi:hypothetical protein
MMSSGRFLSLEVGQIIQQCEFCCILLTTNLTQHDSHGQDDHPKTNDYHHLGMSRDDGMDKHELIGSMGVIW